MTEQQVGRPFYLETGREPVFGFLHRPRHDVWSGIGVVIVGPWGWDEVVTYRSRKDWAEHLAGLGHAVLRIDLPGSGDSGGSASDPQLIEAWAAAVIDAAAFVQERPGCHRVAVIGMGLGGLIAGRAVSDGGPIDDLVLWAVPTTGRSFVREARAFSRLQTSRIGPAGEPEPSLLPDGWLEVGGFVLASKTIDALSSLALTTIKSGRLRRALLLERDGLPIDHDPQVHLRAQGVIVDIARGDGWAAMCADIEQHRPPVEVFATVGVWLGAPRTDSPAGQSDPETIRDAAKISVETTVISESPLTIQQPFGQLFGVLSGPRTIPQPGLCAVFLNAGAIRRIGPNRIWVDAARRWAARGVPSLRLDLEGIGDADGDPGQYADVRAFFHPQQKDQVVATLDALEARGLGPRFVLIGLCSGAFWAFRVASEDARVTAAVLLNPRVLIWDSQLLIRREARAAQKLLDRDSWRRFLRGEIKLSRIAGVARVAYSRAGQVAVAAPARYLRLGGRRSLNPLETALDGMQDRGTKIVIAFSDDEILEAELNDDGFLTRFSRWPIVSLIRLPGSDHTVRPIVAQRAVHELLDEVLDSELDRTAFSPE